MIFFYCLVIYVTFFYIFFYYIICLLFYLLFILLQLHVQVSPPGICFTMRRADGVWSQKYLGKRQVFVTGKVALLLRI